MGKKAPKTPAAPDPAQSAQAQAQVNRLNQILPGGGSILYGKYDANNQFMPDFSHSAVQVLESPFQQQTRQLGENLSLQLANLLGGNVNLPNPVTGLDFGRVSAVPTIDSFSDDARRVESATLDRALGLLRPQLNERRSRTQQQLANQGLPSGSSAYDDEISRLDRSENEALQAATLDAVNAGRQEQQRQFTNALASRQNQVNDQLQAMGANNSARSMLLSELASLLGGQNFAPAGFNGSVNSPNIDVMGAINNNYQAQLNSYNNRLAQQRGLLQNGLGLGGGIFGLL